MAVTIKDIARRANVSITTVSRVINDKHDVSKETKENIKKIIKEMGYRPNEVARGLVTKKTYIIGLLIPDLRNPFYPEMATGLDDLARREGYSVIYYNTRKNAKEEQKAIELFKKKQVDGVVISMCNKTVRKKFKKRNEDEFPIIEIASNLRRIVNPTINIDNVGSACKATRYLIRNGHSKIGHIIGKRNTQPARHTLFGFKKCLKKNNVKLNTDWIKQGDYSKESGYKRMKEILKEDKKPTAVFAANDLMALGCYKAIHEMGLKIPDDISIIGHDDIEYSSYIIPTLTSMYLSMYELGKKSGEMLLRKINDNSNANPENIIIEPKLIERESVKNLSTL